MCSGFDDDGFEPIDLVVGRLVRELRKAVPDRGREGGVEPGTAAREGHGGSPGRAHNAGGGNGVVIEIGKRPGQTEAGPGKVSVRGYPKGGGRSPWITNTGRPSRCGIVRRTKL